MTISMMNATEMTMNLTEFLELFNSKLKVTSKSCNRIFLSTEGSESLDYDIVNNTLRLYCNKDIQGVGSFSLQYEHYKKRIKYYRTFKMQAHKVLYVPMCGTEEEYFQNSLLYDHNNITFDNIQLIKLIHEKVSQC